MQEIGNARWKVADAGLVAGDAGAHIFEAASSALVGISGSQIRARVMPHHVGLAGAPEVVRLPAVG